jgi:hypothetical protein
VVAGPETQLFKRKFERVGASSTETGADDL